MRIIFLLTLSFVFLNTFAQSPGCPQITPVGATICQGQCANLTATAIQNNASTSYAVSSIPYTPFPYSGGTGVSVGTDDVWSGQVNLGFNFCFFGTSYNKVWLGSNGQLCFTSKTAGSYDSYPVNTTLPSSGNTPGNTINVFRDIDPSVSGSNVSYYIGGSAPCRYLVFYFSNVALYSCTTPRSTFQMVLYENTNFIDIYIGNSSGSCSWENGNGIVGIQNAGATVAYTPPGRNGTNWTAVNEGWRFSPTGVSSSVITWYGPGNTVVGTGLGPISVCPTANTTYTSSMVITNCDASTTTYTNTALVTVNSSPTVAIAPSATLNCTGTTAISTTVTPASTYNWSGPGIVSGGTTGTPDVNLPGVYTVSATAAGCTRTATINMVSPSPVTLTASSASICSGGSTPLSVSGASSYTWSPGTGLSATTGAAVTANPAVTTVYTITGATGGCTGTKTVTVTVNPNPSATLTFTNPTCGNSNGIININNTSCCAQTISSFASSLGAIAGQTVTGLGAGTPVITLTNSFGCTYTVSTTLTSTSGPTNLSITPTNATCGNNNGSFTFGTPTGGVSPYTYSINGGPFTAVSPTVGLAPGTYSVTVKDVNSCVYTKTTSISNIAGPTAITGTTTLASCNTNNGTYNVTGVTGGTAVYSFSVDGVATSSLTSGLAAGTHTVLVKDATGCTFSTTFPINTANGPTSLTINTTNSNCGSANGSATVTGVTGGTPTYSYNFDGAGFNTATTTSGLAAGTHTVTVKDVNSCTLTTTYNVANNAAPTIAVTSSLNILCNGASTGSLTVSPTGGTAPFSYTLTSPTQINTTGAFTGLPAGAYNITVRDNFGCTATVAATLVQPTPLTGTISSTPVNCFGNSTGVVSAGGSGGAGSYTYLWPALGNSTLSTVSSATAGTYTVTIKDANLCSITKTVTVTQPASLTLTSTLTPATCGNANGSGTVTVSGGSPGYTYNWSNGGVTNALTGASAGTHTLTVQDVNGCVLTKTVTITNIPGPTAITGTTTIAGCGLNNGTYNVTGVTGGTAVYSFSVDGVSTSSLTTGLAAGTHSVLVKDANSCLFSTTFNITTANGPTSATIVTTNATCGSANGTSTVTGVTGGTPTYSYSFDGGSFTTGTTTSGLSAGTHTVVIKDVNTCTLAVTYTELNNSGPTLAVTNSVNINCFGGSTGSFTATPVGGIAPFTYTLTSPFITNGTGVFTGLPAGAYNVTVRDNSGCTATSSVTLTQPTALTLTVSAQAASCFGSSTGTVSASGSGGVTPYTYLWPALASNTNATVSNVSAGTYSVTQTDANGCSITQSVTVTQPTSLTLTSTLTPATCGNSNGSATVTVGGGTPAYVYNWSNGGITNTLGSVSAGTYTLNVTDFKGCVLTRTITIINIPGPTAITGTTTLAGCGLANGTYNVTGVTGGTSAYSFSVDAVATGSLTGGLLAGTHTVQVSDANNCTFSTTFNIGTTIGPATATVVTSNASCGNANGTATVTTVSGGAPTYQYSFDGGVLATGSVATGLSAGIHTLTIVDANSCTLTVNYNVLNNGTPVATVPTTTNTSCFGGSNGGFTVVGSGGSGAPFTYTLTSPFQNNGTGIFTGLPANTYSVIVKDNAGCIVNTTATITEPSAVTLSPSSIPAKCFGTSTGTINITGAGGTSPYQYSLNGAGYQGANSYTAVGAAIYNVSIKDFNGCIATQTVQVNQPTALTIQVATQNANCTAANGVASSTVTGGTPIYTYTWTGGGGASNVSNPMVAGTYTVTATDANGCVISSAAVIGVTPGGTATITASSNVKCNGACDGSLTAGMIGGAAPFTYQWSPGGQTSAVATNLCPNTYTCQIVDFYGCVASVVGTITEPSVLSAVMNSNNVKCFGTATGTVSAAGTGGTGPYTYLWPGIPSTAGTVPNVAIGNYVCNITDFNGCTITQSISVTEPTPISLTSTVTSANCGQPNGSATITASGGAPGAYTYSWSPGSTTTIQSNIAAGTYTIAVRDANNCLQTLAVTIPDIAGPTLSISSQTNVSCYGACNGAALTSASGGVAPYIYSWSNGNVASIASNLCAQIYTVSITDQAGCVASTSISISQPTQLTVGIVASNPKCFGSTDGYGIAAALGGTPGYTYSWSGGGGNNSTSGLLGAGAYNLLVTDGNGCTVTSTMSLVNPPAMVASITSTNVLCFGACNGMATATSTNGIGAVGYYWVGGANPISSQTASGLCAGSYTMTATDQNNCTASAIVSITQPPLLTANISSTGSVTCNGGSNGYAVVTPGGGTPGYTYSWSGSASSNGNSANASGLSAGTFTVTVTDTKDCSVTANVTILEPAPLSPTLTTTNAKCNGACDGTANIAYTGGTGATSFLWLPGLQSGNFVNNLCAGNQTVTMTYNGSCTSLLTFTLTEPALLTAVGSATASNCGQANGKTCVTISGGTSPFTSTLWSNGVTSLCNNNVTAGAYNFQVIDFNGCVANASGLVNDIAGPVVAITGYTDVSCFGGSNGAATTSITGGTGAISISWSLNNSTTQNVTNFNANIHNVTVTDAAGCVGTASVLISQPTKLVSAIGSYTDVTCSGLSNGGATVLANGGTMPYSYTWTPSSQTSSVMINVPANTYTAFVSDANGCLTSSQAIVSQPQPLLLSASGFTNISCYGGSNGQISTTIQGGTPGYIYTWSPSQFGNSGVLGGLAAGGYSLTVVDTKNCFVNTTFQIIEPPLLTSSYVSSPAKCGVPNGSATVTVQGGTPNYVINWNTSPAQQGLTASNMSPGNLWTANITDSKGCSITQTVSVADAPGPILAAPVVVPPTCFGYSDGTITLNYSSGTAPYTVIWPSPLSQTMTTSALTQSITGVAGGNYLATVKDNYGCTTSQQIAVIPPGKLILNVSSDVTICYGRSTQLSASGYNGSPGYTYTWTPTSFSGGGPHNVSPTTTSAYNVIVQDSKGCSDGPKVITVNVTQPLVATGGSSTICNNGEAVLLSPTITNAGNGGPYSYTWSPTAPHTSSITVYGTPAPLAATTTTYAVLVSDGCTIPNATAVFTVNVNPLPNATFIASYTSACAPAVIDFTATPSVAGGYTYQWVDVTNKAVMGTTNPVSYNFTQADSTTVSLLITNTVTGCSNTITKNNYIVIYPQPIASFYAEPPIASILDPNFNFINTTQGASYYYWDFGDPAATNGNNNSTVTNPSHWYGYVGQYAVNLVAISDHGCKDFAKVIVEVTPDFALYIPNAFTPDGNGVNDIFQPLGVGIDEDNYRLDIFDRWGENIFSSNNFRKGWDGSVKGGKMAEQGVYTYKIVVKDIQGNNHPYVGHVTVIKKENQ
ncbi:MAG: gliding motility-associated C-terminal domain-containing protein [Bacteroidetes bacterium]|nr:gliding motility-associated C-terminal domain-containing protein [Bacteroidota bacterium]